jgi:ferritin
MMMISQALSNAINQQIANEFGAQMQYLSIAAYFEGQGLKLLAKLFFEQAEEEKEHAMKFVRYILDTMAELQIPGINAPNPNFGSAEEAVGAALKWEKEVTGQVNNLVKIALSEDDHLAYTFLQWFVTEQLEEVNKMQTLLDVVKRAGERNLLMVEAYLIHISQVEG